MLTGALGGLIGGLTGVGGGALMIPLMTRLSGLPQHVAHGTSLAIVAAVAIAGAATYIANDLVEWDLVAALLGGSVILEKLFNWPGLGKLFIESILQRDYPVAMALSTATAVLVLLANLFVDLLYGVVDPRVRQK